MKNILPLKPGSCGRNLLLGFASVALFSASNAAAATLFTFSTLDNGGAANTYNPAFVSVSLAPNLTGPSVAADITAAASTLTAFNNSEWNGFSVFVNPPVQAAGVTSDNWLTRGAFVFTLTADEGYTMDLSSLDFLGARGFTSNTRGFQIYASVNGITDFNTDLVISVPNMDTSYTRASPHSYSLDLSGARYQDISSITFRYIPLASNTSNSVEFNGFTVNGIVAVPEPSTWAVASLALLGVVAASRRRRRRS